MDKSELAKLKSRVNSLNSLTEEERKFIVSYYRNGKKLSKTVDKADYNKWASWIRTHKNIFYKLEHNNSTALCLSVANAQNFILQESTELINKLKTQDVIKASPHIVRTLELIANVTGLNNRKLEIEQKTSDSNGSILHQLSTEQIQQLASAVADGVKRIEYASNADVAEVVEGDGKVCDVVRGDVVEVVTEDTPPAPDPRN